MSYTRTGSVSGDSSLQPEFINQEAKQIVFTISQNVLVRADKVIRGSNNLKSEIENPKSLGDSDECAGESR
jgi:hypothetical protein